MHDIGQTDVAVDRFGRYLSAPHIPPGRRVLVSSCPSLVYSLNLHRQSIVAQVGFVNVIANLCAVCILLNTLNKFTQMPLAFEACANVYIYIYTY